MMLDTGPFSGVKSAWLKSLAIVLPILAGCESELVNLQVPDAAVAGESFEVTVDHVFVDDLESFGSSNGSFVFAAVVPANWDVESASYAGTVGGEPFELPATASGFAPSTSPELLDELGLGCSASVTLRPEAGLDSPPVATLLSTFAPAEFAAREVNPNLAAYAENSLFVVMHSTSCGAGPMGVIADGLSLDTGTGNLLSNASFESGLSDWTPDSNDGCISQTYGEGETTAGAGGWTTPEPSNGAALYASDTGNPGECVFSQQVDIPAGAGESSFAGTVGANFLFFDGPVDGAAAAFMDLSPPEFNDNQQLLWFRTDTLPSMDFEEGDGGTSSVVFVANNSGENIPIIFYHGYYSETPFLDEEVLQALSLAASSEQTGWPARKPALAAAAEQPETAAAESGFLGASFWFQDSEANDGFPQSIDDEILILPGSLPVPAMGGVALLILALSMAGLGMRRRFRSEK